jgi:hypothetical protein
MFLRVLVLLTVRTGGSLFEVNRTLIVRVDALKRSVLVEKDYRLMETRFVLCHSQHVELNSCVLADELRVQHSSTAL